MAIRKIHELPNELPHARLYLDDIEEISKILLEACSASLKKFGEELNIVYTIGDSQMDSIEDLQTRGGSTTALEIKVGKWGSAGVHFRGILKPTIALYSLERDQAWAVYAKIKSIFDRHQLRFKNAVANFPTWLNVALYFVIVLGLPFLIGFIPSKSNGGFPSRAVYAGGCFIFLVIVGVSLFWPSSVLLVRSHESSKTASATKRGYVRDLVFLVLGALIAGLARHFLK